MPHTKNEQQINYKTKYYMKMSMALAAAFMLNLNGFANVTAPPVAVEEAIGNWIGYSRGATHFYRLEIEETGGWVSYLFVGHDPVVYRIEKWSMDKKGRLEFTLTPISENASPILIESEPVTSQNYFRITVRAAKAAKNRGWVHQIDIYNNKVISRNTAILNQSITDAQGKAVRNN